MSGIHSYMCLIHLICITGFLASSGVAQAQGPTAGREIIERAAQASLPEFFELLSIPNDAINPEDIQKNVRWLVEAFRKRGFVTRELPNEGKPLLFAEYPARVASAGTILFYMHLDGQPVVADKWAQKSPWVPVVKRRIADGRWEMVDAGRPSEAKLDRDLRVFARSASDDKGPIMMFLAAFDAMKSAGQSPAFNVKVLLDSEEEKGSPRIGVVAKAHKEILAADAILIHDGPMHSSGRPTMIFGNRGNVTARLTVFGPRSELHSGHYGNYVPNPAQRLAALLAAMKDEDGRVLVPGYYDGVRLSAAEQATLAAVPDDEAEIRKRIGIAKPETVGRNYQEALQYPSLNIRGMAAAEVGNKASNIIPSTAVAELDLRTTPGADPGRLLKALEAFIRGKGYHLVQNEPTDEERATFERIAALTMFRGSSAAFTSMDSPLGAWVQSTLASTYDSGRDKAGVVRIRMMGGSVPTDKLIDALGLPFVIVPLVNPDNNQHSSNENIRIGHYIDGTRFFASLLVSPLARTR